MLYLRPEAHVLGAHFCFGWEPRSVARLGSEAPGRRRPSVAAGLQLCSVRLASDGGHPPDWRRDVLSMPPETSENRPSAVARLDGLIEQDCFWCSASGYRTMYCRHDRCIASTQAAETASLQLQRHGAKLSIKRQAKQRHVGRARKAGLLIDKPFEDSLYRFSFLCLSFAISTRYAPPLHCGTVSSQPYKPRHYSLWMSP